MSLNRGVLVKLTHPDSSDIFGLSPSSSCRRSISLPRRRTTTKLSTGKSKSQPGQVCSKEVGLTYAHDPGQYGQCPPFHPLDPVSHVPPSDVFQFWGSAPRTNRPLEFGLYDVDKTSRFHQISHFVLYLEGLPKSLTALFHQDVAPIPRISFRDGSIVRSNLGMVFCVLYVATSTEMANKRSQSSPSTKIHSVRAGVHYL